MQPFQESNTIQDIIAEVKQNYPVAREFWPYDISRAASYIESNLFNENLNVALVKNKCFIFNNQFHSRFKLYAGTVPKRYINVLRVHVAKHLLVNTCYTISEIAVGIGYSSVSSFSNSFKREFGLRPSKFR